MKTLKSFAEVNTNSGVARLFFNTGRDAINFLYRNNVLNPVSPLFIIYKGILLTHSGFTDFETEFHRYSCREATSMSAEEFTAFYNFILHDADNYRLKSLVSKKELADLAAHAAAASADFMKANAQAIGVKIPIDKKLSDKLQLQQLENSLNDALSAEDYEAAAAIRNKITANGWSIIESNGVLKVRRNQSTNSKTP